MASANLPATARQIQAAIAEGGATDDMQEALKALLPSAAYFETWLAYFDFVESRGGQPTADVVVQAASQVGADPLSAELWIRLIAYADHDRALKRELLHSAVQTPLHVSHRIFALFSENEKAYREANVRDDVTAALSLQHQRASQQLRREPPWGNRNAEIAEGDHRGTQQLLAEWNTALRHMFTDLREKAYGLDPLIQLQRIDLAFRQVRAQLPFVESCWVEHARFTSTCMSDAESARQIVAAGAAACGGRPMLSVGAQAFALDMGVDLGTLTDITVHQRAKINRLDKVPPPAEAKKQFRDVGKQAEAAKVSAAPVYAQWAMVENGVLQDYSMAAKVFERGALRTSESIDDFAAVCRAAVAFHTGRAQETEVQQYGERWVAAAGSAQSNGLLHGAWQRLVRAEMDLHGGAVDAIQQREQQALHLPACSYEQFLARHSAGNLFPATDDELRFVQFLSDVEIGTMDDTDFLPTSFRRASRWNIGHDVALPSLSASPFVSVNLGSDQWVPLRMPANPVPLCSLPSPDDVCGPRHLRGQLVGRLEISRSLQLKVAKDKRRRQRCAAASANITQTSLLPRSLTRLVEALQEPIYHPQQLQACRLIDVQWLFGNLTQSDLALGAGKQQKSNR